MRLVVVNAQKEAPVDLPRMQRLARRAVRRLRIRTRGTLAIAFIDSRRMRTLNKRFLRHDRATDVLSFRYDHHGAGGGGWGTIGTPIVGELLIAPLEARRYAAAHGLAYTEELSRYVMHGLLHWLGHEDRTKAQQQRMRRMEDRLLA
ncbi:MAG: rRNA maturation RNase YbeY [Candidatus Omnitrophica bacterium]|nr:rRNA maturation RNase YbeY [Candidatus Omnitrophota bacterium]